VDATPWSWLGQNGSGEHAFSLGGAVVRGWQLNDALGRTAKATVELKGDRLLLQLKATVGVYLLSLTTDRGTAVLRFAHSAR
jgi:hypothetical protein